LQTLLCRTWTGSGVFEASTQACGDLMYINIYTGRKNSWYLLLRVIRSSSTSMRTCTWGDICSRDTGERAPDGVDHQPPWRTQDTPPMPMADQSSTGTSYSRRYQRRNWASHSQRSRKSVESISGEPPPSILET
jgi:hypothetical protein